MDGCLPHILLYSGTVLAAEGILKEARTIYVVDLFCPCIASM